MEATNFDHCGNLLQIKRWSNQILVNDPLLCFVVLPDRYTFQHQFSVLVDELLPSSLKSESQVMRRKVFAERSLIEKIQPREDTRCKLRTLDTKLSEPKGKGPVRLKDDF